MKMKRTVFFLCITMALLVGISARALATGKLKQIQAYLNYGITIQLDGETQSMYDVNGNRVYPISYNGTTYVPIRAVSTMLGLDVEWDGASNTVLLGDNDVVPKTKITDLSYYNRKSVTDGQEYTKVNMAKDNLGKSYVDPLCLMRSCETNYWESYMLTEDYSTFSGTLFIDYDDRDSATTCNVRIYGDDELLYSSPTLTKGVKPISFTVDIQGVDELKLEINGKWSSGYDWLGVYLADGVFE